MGETLTLAETAALMRRSAHWFSLNRARLQRDAGFPKPLPIGRPYRWPAGQVHRWLSGHGGAAESEALEPFEPSDAEMRQRARNL